MASYSTQNHVSKRMTFWALTSFQTWHNRQNTLYIILLELCKIECEMVFRIIIVIIFFFIAVVIDTTTTTLIITIIIIVISSNGTMATVATIVFRKCRSHEPLAHCERWWLIHIVQFMMNLEEMAHYEFEICTSHEVFNKKWLIAEFSNLITGNIMKIGVVASVLCMCYCHFHWYRKTSIISRTKSQNLNVSCILLQLSSHSIHWNQVLVENEDVVGAVPTGDAPITSELSTILLPTKVRLILEVLWYYHYHYYHHVMFCLTHYGLMTPYGNRELGQHWSRWWLVAWRHQVITWTNVDLSSARSLGIHLRALSEEIVKIPISKTTPNINFFNIISRFPRANDLISFSKMYISPPYIESGSCEFV